MPQNKQLHSMRNRHFMEACRRVIAESPTPLTAEQIAFTAARRPAPAFYVSYGQALRRIRDYRKNHGGNFPREGAMSVYAELNERTKRKMHACRIPETQALSQVLADGNAPCFFMKPRAAAFLYYRLRSLARSERRQRIARLSHTNDN